VSKQLRRSDLSLCLFVFSSNLLNYKKDMNPYRNKRTHKLERAPKRASTAIAQGDWLEYDYAGAVRPLTPGVAVVGLSYELVSASDTDYTSNRLISYEAVDSTQNRFVMNVATGTALASMIGSVYNIDGADSSKLDVSAGGTQFEITKVFATDKVEVKVVQLAGIYTLSL